MDIANILFIISFALDILVILLIGYEYHTTNIMSPKRDIRTIFKRKHKK